MRFVSVVFVRHHNVPGAAAATLGSLDKGKEKLSIWKIVQVQSLRIRLKELAYLMFHQGLHLDFYNLWKYVLRVSLAVSGRQNRLRPDLGSGLQTEQK